MKEAVQWENGCLRLPKGQGFPFPPESAVVNSVFVRECYEKWFGLFIDSILSYQTTNHALSSTPGCGKTMSFLFILAKLQTTDVLRDKPILYQFGDTYHYYTSSNVFLISRERAYNVACDANTFYIIDGKNAVPLPSKCLTLFIASPRNDYFKDWYFHKKITPLYFPVWSLEEILDCRIRCYSSISEEAVKDRYKIYGGVARFVFWPGSTEPPSIASAVQDANARKSIRSVWEPSLLFPTSHMLLHLVIDDKMHFTYVTLASQHVGVLLFSKYFEETLERLQSLLGAGGALAGHLFECYIHYLFEFGSDTTLTCRSLEGLRVHTLCMLCSTDKLCL